MWKNKKKENIAVFMEAVTEKDPNQQIYIVWDNLNIHIEIWFGILQRKAIRHSSLKSEEDLRNKVLGFIAWWNHKEAHPFKWQYREYIEAA
jgi:hypothetical protein